MNEMLNQNQEESQYIAEARKRYDYVKKFIKNTVVSKNWYLDPKYTLAKPYTTLEEEQTALRKYRDRPSNALRESIFNHLMIHAMNSAVYQLNHWRKWCKDINEFISFNLEKLWECVDSYDESKGTSFATYFTTNTNFKIKEHLYHTHPQSLVTWNVQRNFDILKSRLNREGYDTLDKILNIEPNLFLERYRVHIRTFVKAWIQSSLKHIDDNIGADGDLAWKDLIVDRSQTPEAQCISDSIIEEVLNSVHQLFDGKDRNIAIWMEYCVGGESSFSQIGKKYNLTRERTRQIVARINRGLKSSPNIQSLYDDMYHIDRLSPQEYTESFLV